MDVQVKGTGCSRRYADTIMRLPIKEKIDRERFDVEIIEHSDITMHIFLIDKYDNSNSYYKMIRRPDVLENVISEMNIAVNEIDEIVGRTKNESTVVNNVQYSEDEFLP